MAMSLIVVGTCSSGNSSNFRGFLQNGHVIGVCTASSKHGIPLILLGISASFALWLIDVERSIIPQVEEGSIEKSREEKR